MKNVLALIVISTSLSLLPMMVLLSQIESVSLKEINNNKLDFTLEIPSNWEIIEQDLGVDLIGLAPLAEADLFRENFNILSVKLDTPITAKEYYDYNLSSLEQLLVDFDLEKSEDVMIDNVEARKILFTHTMGVVNVKVVQYLMLTKEKAFVMTFTAARMDYDKMQPEFDRIANSFKFRKIP